MYVLSLRFPGSSRQMNSTRRSSPPGHLTVMGQKGGRGDAKYATGSVSNKRGRQLRKSRRVFPRKNRVFQHAHTVLYLSISAAWLMSESDDIA